MPTERRRSPCATPVSAPPACRWRSHSVRTSAASRRSRPVPGRRTFPGRSSPPVCAGSPVVTVRPSAPSLRPTRSWPVRVCSAGISRCSPAPAGRSSCGWTWRRPPRPRPDRRSAAGPVFRRRGPRWRSAATTPVPSCSCGVRWTRSAPCCSPTRTGRPTSTRRQARRGGSGWPRPTRSGPPGSPCHWAPGWPRAR